MWDQIPYLMMLCFRILLCFSLGFPLFKFCFSRLLKPDRLLFHFSNSHKNLLAQSVPPECKQGPQSKLSMLELCDPPFSPLYIPSSLISTLLMSGRDNELIVCFKPNPPICSIRFEKAPGLHKLP